jgi:hypothetical protein
MPDRYWTQLENHFSKGTQAALIGLPLAIRSEEGQLRYSNSAIALAPQATPASTAGYQYDKHHLVPFGEFVPPLFQWFVRMMNIPLGDFSRGDVVQPSFAFKGERIAPNICYEDLFGEELARSFADPDKAPTLMVNLSNIAWFGDTVAIDQHRPHLRGDAAAVGRRRGEVGGVAAGRHGHGFLDPRLYPIEIAALDRASDLAHGVDEAAGAGACPTTMAEMQEIMHKLGADASRVRPLFISVDAERDTPAMMGSYAAAFDTRITAGVIGARQLDRLRKYGKTFWVTEFANWHSGDGPHIDTVEAQKAQMTEMVAECESRADVFRYAWFTGRWENDVHHTSLLGASGELTALGRHYVSLPFTNPAGEGR